MCSECEYVLFLALHLSGRVNKERDHDSQPLEDSQYQSRGGKGGYRDGPDRYYNNQRQRGRYSARDRGRDSKGGGGSATKQAYRFDSDFDFETANARFDREQLEKEMKKMTIDDDEKNNSSSEINGEPRSPEVIVVEDEEGDEQQVDGAESKTPLYDKDDFFDSISCESMQMGGNK